MGSGTAAALAKKYKPLISGYAHSSVDSANLYSKLGSCGNPTDARQLFDKLSHRDSAHYNLMIKRYTQSRQPTQALHLFAQMLASGECRPDNFTYPFVFKAIGDSPSSSMLRTGEAIHCRAFLSGYISNQFVSNSLISMYMTCGRTGDGKRVFDCMTEKTVVSWNTMISGYFSNGRASDAVTTFDRMVHVDGITPDQATLVSVLPACASLKDLQRGRLIHELVEHKGIGYTTPLTNSLLDMYAKCGCLLQARSVFDNMIHRDVVSWTAMMAGYVLHGHATTALSLCLPMQLDGIRPNFVTVATLLSACVTLSHLMLGRCIHGWVTRCRLHSHVTVETSLIHLYAKCNRVDLSLRVFTNTSRKRTIPWNAIITGYVHNGLHTDAIHIFIRMHVEMVEPDCTTLICLLPAYAALADLQMANNIHSYLIQTGLSLNTEISTSLIDIYSKSGSLESAHQVFNRIPKEDKDVITWSTIIAGYGMHGHGEIAIAFFHQMLQAGIKPNQVTFTSLLHACSHAGLVDQGLQMFRCMVLDHRTTPRTDHYTCIIDLVGRAGRLSEAFELIQAMSLEPNHAVWGALLGACVIHQNVELGQVAAEKLFKIEPNSTGNYILLSKLYAAVGRWEDAEQVRIMIKEKRLKKSPACSSIDVGNMTDA